MDQRLIKMNGITLKENSYVNDVDKKRYIEVYDEDRDRTHMFIEVSLKTGKFLRIKAFLDDVPFRLSEKYDYSNLLHTFTLLTKKFSKQ